MSPRQRIHRQEVVETQSAEPRPTSPTSPNLTPQNLMEGYQGLVRALAWKIHRKLPPHVDLEDVVAYGQVGLAEAARDFEPARGRKFTTYAYYRIRGAIFDGLSTLGWFSRHHYHSSRYEHMADELLRLESRDEYDPSTEGGTRWLKGVASSLAVVYLMTGRDEDEGSRQELVDEASPSPPAVAIENEIREKLHHLIDALPSDAEQLIRAVYFEGITLQEAGERLGISKAWASRLHARTLQRLAHALRLVGVGG